MLGFMYGQTEYQMLENAIHLEDYVSFGVDNGFSFLTITDSNLHGHFKFYNLCKENNIKPVIGLSVKISSSVNRENIVLLYAKNKIGYQNLLQISSKQALEGSVDDEFIIKHSNGLFLVSSALESDLDYLIYCQEYSGAVNELKRLQGLTKEFYLGVMPSSFLYATIYQDLFKLKTKYNLVMLPVSKTSYLSQNDELVYHSLLKIGETNKVLSIDDLHLKTKEELEEEFNEIKFVFDNLNSVIDSISDDIISFDHPLPIFQNKLGISSGEYLSKLCKKGLDKRLLNSNTNKNEYLLRLEYELNIINKMNYNDYFLIVWDFVKFAKNNKILVGPGRGSAPGSLVAYCLGITEIDPIKYGLLFERFLNPERVSMPDIDIDFPDDKRDIVINYVKEKYGDDHVCYISAFGTFQLKSSVRDLFRITGYDSKYIDVVIKLLERNASEEEIKKELGNHHELIELISIAKKMEGLPRHISTHAAGIILSSSPLSKTIPLRGGMNNMYQSQLEAVDLEKLGLLKIDFLGIRNLSLVSDMINEILKIEPTFDIRNIPFSDEKTFKLLSSGDTLGIFQLESTGITNVIKKMKPTKFEDLVAVLALYRPGPMDNINEYIERKHGKEFTYLHPDLKDILEDTYGIIIYQEQIMKIAQVFAGYSLGEADILRRAVSKKKKDVLEALRDKFINSSVSNGYDVNVAEKIYNYIEKFADYGFNRSHTVAYGIFSYQMAYIKANYFNVFISKILNNVIGNDSELANYVKYCIGKGIEIYPPNVNTSTNRFVLDKEGLIMPINAIHSIGSLVSKKIVDERKNGEFKDFFDFKTRMSTEVNSRMLENLIYAGFFDSFGKSHSYLMQNINSSFSSYISGSESIDNLEEYGYDKLKEDEYNALGFNLKYNNFKEYQKYFAIYKATNPNELVVDKKVNVVGIVKRVKSLKTKKGDYMAFVTLDCNNQLLDLVLFSEVYNKYLDVLNSKDLILVNGFVRERNDSLQIQVEKMKELKS